MPDRNIPFFNVILKCENYTYSEIALPKGYYFRNYQPGDEKEWAELEYEIGDFETADMAEEYFVSKYCQNINDVRDRCMFVLNSEGQTVGSCTAWRDHRGNQTAASLHWLAVSSSQRGKKLGKALCQRVLEIFRERGEFPVYIHTQPWSYAAILLYVRMGFKLQISDTFSDYENQYVQSMKVLKSILTEQQYQELVENSSS